MKKCFNIANNQIVVIEDNKKMFFSYGSYIASYEYNDIDTYTLTLTSLYDYSKTTSKYLKVFLQDYCNFYYKDTKELKELIQKGGCDNVTIQVAS